MIPLWNLAAAVAVVRMRRNRRKSAPHRLAWLAALAMLLASCAASLFMLFISAQNYPGGQALYHLHQQAAPMGAWRTGSMGSSRGTTEGQAPVSVHVDVLPAMSGVSRFLELDSPWQYSKVPYLLHRCCSWLALADVVGSDRWSKGEGWRRERRAWGRWGISLSVVS